MSIDPTAPNSLPGIRPEPGSTRGARQTGDLHIGIPRPDSRGSESTAGDQVELSHEARAANTAGAGMSASGLSPSRLREVLQRLTSGFYDTAQVRDAVARRVRDQLDV